MKSPLKIAGAAVAAVLLTTTFSSASDEDTVVLVNGGQGQYSVTYLQPDHTPMVALNVNNQSIRSDTRYSADKTSVAPRSIRVGQSSTITYPTPER